MYFNQGYENWESLEALDDLTVQLTLVEPNATQLLVFTRPDGYIISPKALDEYGQEVGLNMSMAGPTALNASCLGRKRCLLPTKTTGRAVPGSIRSSSAPGRTKPPFWRRWKLAKSI